MEPIKLEEFIRQLDTEIKKSQTEAYNAEVLDRLKETAAVYQGEDKIVRSNFILDRIKGATPELQIMSGWKGLDDILKGFRLNQLVVVAAPTKNGKTSFLMDLTSRIQEHNVLWFPFEEGADELVQKYLDRDEAPPHFTTPERMMGNTLQWVEKKIIESIAKYDTRVVIIDHLHFIVDMLGNQNMSLLIGKTMRELKAMAKRWGVCIFVIAHLKKTKLELAPDLEDIRDSSFIAQEADTVILLWRESKRENNEIVITDNVNLSVQANRRTGKTGNVKLVYADGHFTETDWGAFKDDVPPKETKIKQIKWGYGK